MSDPRQLANYPLGVVDHVDVLSEDVGRLFMQPDLSDVVLKVGSKRFSAHKVILAARSDFFKALLFGGLKESSEETVELKDIPADAFEHLLKYIYDSRLNLADMQEDMLLDVLGLANRFMFKELVDAISEYLKAVLDNRNVCNIYDVSCLYGLTDLGQKCCSFIDQNAQEIMQSDAFLQISKEALRDLLNRDSFWAPEIEIFHAVVRWTDRNPDENVKEVVKKLRLPLMSMDQLLHDVRGSKLLSPDTILDAIHLRNESTDMALNYRGFLIAEENVATTQHNAHVVKGEMKASLLDGDHQHYDLDRGFTRHPLDDPGLQGIVVKLGKPFIINKMRMLLWDRDMRSYSYYIEVSMDEKDWVRIVDHTRYLCRSWQTLYFEPKVMRYVRIVGTHNTVNRVFHLVSFECMFTNFASTPQKGITVPETNVASMEHSACVIEGVSRSRNALINGDVKHYDWDSGYTCHQLGSGAIVVQLAQPFVISSLRLLLWDCDNRSYCYYVQVSTDNVKWKTIVDKREEPSRSWQTCVFKPCVAVFIKIIGTHNTANEVFHCVHFECPANAAALKEYYQRQASLEEISPSPIADAHTSRSCPWPASRQASGNLPAVSQRPSSAENFSNSLAPRNDCIVPYIPEAGNQAGPGGQPEGQPGNQHDH